MANQIRQYHNKLFIDFEQRGDNFTIHVPHKPVWDAIIRFMRKRGWKIGENKSIKENFTTLSKYHKLGRKGSVAVLMEISSSSIELNFGHEKNLWTGIAQSFWPKGDDRYTSLSYLEEKSVELELKKVFELCTKWAEPKKMEWQMDAVTKILEKERTNAHIHGGATSLEHLKELMESRYGNPYQGKYNLVDKNKKLIYCGEIKYFYDEYRTKRLIRGTVYHNMNNMWWVILPCGTLRNIACFKLFDFDPLLPKRQKLSESDRNKLLLQLTEKALKDRDFLKLQSLSKVMEKIGKEATHV